MNLYAPRPVRFIELMGGRSGEPSDARIKLYGVTAKEGQRRPREEIVRAAKLVAFDLLEKPHKPSISDGPAIAIACVHEANGGDYFLFGQWDGNVLLPKVHIITPTSLEPAPGNPLCTWDLAILAFERNAWVNRVLKNPTPVGIEAYLNHVLNRLL